MSGTLVSMGTGGPARTHQNLKILGTAGYRVPRKFQKLCTAGYRLPARKIFSVPMGTGHSQTKISGNRWVLGTGKIFNDADP